MWGTWAAYSVYNYFYGYPEEEGMGAEERTAEVNPEPNSETDTEQMAEDQSLVHVNDASRLLYEQRTLVKDDDSLSLPFSPLIGESPLYVGATTEGIICLSDYRLYVSINPFFNIPLGLIEMVECKDIYHLYIYCKDCKTFRCTFSDNLTLQKWLIRIQEELVPKPLDQNFAFIFLSWSRDKDCEYYRKKLEDNKPVISVIDEEAKRLEFNLEEHWKISEINIEQKFCPSYPRHLIVPHSVTDDFLTKVASFRYSRRIPVPVWRHKKNGCIIARSSQPKVGLWFRNRCEEDEQIIQALADSCAKNPGVDKRPSERDLYSIPTDIGSEEMGNGVGTTHAHKVLVVDARSFTAAVANRAKGGGSETTYYENCEVLYQGLVNIHSIRKSFQGLRLLCSVRPDPTTWLSSLESTGWLQYIPSLIHSALVVVNAIDVEQQVVLVHCSDGWDRTSQIVALAELMLDSFYRTKKGFQVLVEKEWLEFGHKFADRCGNATGSQDPNERSPVFLQWLDCVFQLVDQFPACFEFNKQYLVKLVHYSYSGLFGTFLCNTDKERRENNVPLRTFSIWSHLNDNQNFHNHFYKESTEVLKPSCSPNIIKFWNDVYFPAASTSSGVSSHPISHEPVVARNVEEEPLVKTKSYEDIHLACHSATRQRRSSDNSIGDLACFTESMEKDLTPLPHDEESPHEDDIFVGNNSSGEGTQRTSTVAVPVPPGRRHLSSESSIMSLEVVGSLVSDVSNSPGQSGINTSYEELSVSCCYDQESNAAAPSQNAAVATEQTSDNPSDSLVRTMISSVPESNQPNSTLPTEIVPRHVLDIDGSVVNCDEIQYQVGKIIVYFKGEIRRLQKELDDFKKSNITVKESEVPKEIPAVACSSSSPD